jgi:hypothetical protein
VCVIIFTNLLKCLPLTWFNVLTFPLFCLYSFDLVTEILTCLDKKVTLFCLTIEFETIWNFLLPLMWGRHQIHFYFCIYFLISHFYTIFNANSEKELFTYTFMFFWTNILIDSMVVFSIILISYVIMTKDFSWLKLFLLIKHWIFF